MTLCIICLSKKIIKKATKDYYGYSLCDDCYKWVIENNVDIEELEEYVIKIFKV